VTVTDWLIGYRKRRPEPRWQRGIAFPFTTRYFLIDRKRFIGQVCPLIARVGERLEDAVTRTMRERGFELWVLADDENWAIHPSTHNDNHTHYLAELIRIVESGRQPFRRTGFRWDLRTESRHWHFMPWRIAIERDRLLRR
jgi:hypothetical protein